MRCCVNYCTNDNNYSEEQSFTFHSFPTDYVFCQLWLNAVGHINTDTKNSVVCSDHFRDEDYCIRNGVRELRYGAIPFCDQDSSVATLKVCRICLARNTKMYSIKKYGLDEMYQEITGINEVKARSIPAKSLYGLLKDIGLSRTHVTSLLERVSKAALVNINMNYPQQICWECAARLKSSSRFKEKALRTDSIMKMLIDNNKHMQADGPPDSKQSPSSIDIVMLKMTITDLKYINREKNKLKSSLIYTYLESHDYIVEIQDDLIPYKNKLLHNGDQIHDTLNEKYTETQSTQDVEGTVQGTDNVQNSQELPEIMQIEIKHETNDIYFDEYNNMSDSDDDRTLSEVISKPKREKKRSLKKKKVKDVKAVKRKNVENPTNTSEKFKTTDIKRRRTQEQLDETLFTINTLTYEEQIAEIQKRQESVKYTSAPYKCTACYRGFLTKDRYDVHVIRHTDQSGTFECFICKSRMKTARALRKHLTGQHTEKYSCKGCPFVTRNRGVAREHEKWHNGAKYQCPHCPTEFDKLTTYLGHIRIKHVSDFVCELCGYTFVSEKGIEVHKKKKHRLSEHTVVLEGPYCEVCNVKFVSEDAHARHLKLSSRHSSDSDPNKIRNDSQSMSSEGKNRSRVERRAVIHRERRELADSGGPVTCEQCGIQLRDLRLYAQHFRRAHPDKNRTKYPAMKTPCMCEQCGRIFQSMCLLKDHMWVHTGEKRFKCDRCDKSFTQKTNLVFHMRVHSASRPSYECTLCGKHFAFYNNRRRHMFIHTGLKPYKCDTCGKSFTTAGEQRAHVEHVHMKKPWPKRARQRRELALADE